MVSEVAGVARTSATALLDTLSKAETEEQLRRARLKAAV